MSYGFRHRLFFDIPLDTKVNVIGLLPEFCTIEGFQNSGANKEDSHDVH